MSAEVKERWRKEEGGGGEGMGRWDKGKGVPIFFGKGEGERHGGVQGGYSSGL